MFKQSRSILCKIFFEDVNNFCLYNPFRFSRGLIFLFSKYFNLYRLNYHKQSKIFYKRLLLKKNKFRHKKYFKKIRLFKKKILLFFSFRTFKQLSFFFTNIFFKKSIFLFNLLLNLFELRVDFIVYRLRCVFSLFDSRQFIQNNGVFIDNEYYFNYTKQISIGSVISFSSKNILFLYLKFYYYWFNEYIYANKLRNFKLFNKIILLKKFKKKLSFFRNFFFKKFIFFKTNYINSYLKKYTKLTCTKIYLNNLKKQINKFQLLNKIFFLKINKFIYLFLYFFIYNFYLFIIIKKNLFKLNIIENYKKKFSYLEYKNTFQYTKIFFNKLDFLILLNYFINFLNLKALKLKYVFLKKIRIKNYKKLFNRRLFSKSSLLNLNKKKYFKFILLLKQLVTLKINKFPQLCYLYKFEKHPKLQNLLRGFKRKIKFSFYRLKKIFSKKKRRLNLKFFLRFKRLKRIKFRLFRIGFNILYKLNNRIYRPRYLKKNKMHFFSFYKRVNQGFKYSFVDNRLAFRPELNKLTRFLGFKNLSNFSFSIFINIFQYKLQTLFLKFRNRIKKKFYSIWKVRNFKLNTLKFFYINKTTDFYNLLYRLKKYNLFFSRFKFLLKQGVLKTSFSKLKKYLLNFKLNNIYYKKFYFFKSLYYLNKFVIQLQKKYRKFKKRRKIYLRFFFKKRFKFWDSGFKLNLTFLKKDLFASKRHYLFNKYNNNYRYKSFKKNTYFQFNKFKKNMTNKNIKFKNKQVKNLKTIAINQKNKKNIKIIRKKKHMNNNNIRSLKKPLIINKKKILIVDKKKPLIINKKKPLIINKKKPLIINKKKILIVDKKKPLIIDKKKKIFLKEVSFKLNKKKIIK